jgi:multiple sugar transport system ATP-binding protein
MSLELKNIYKVYSNGYQAITDFNLEIKDKEFIVLVGPSGCGKSTTLRMIAGLEEITHGDFIIDGKKVNNLPPKDRGIAMVFQSYALYPTLTVYENMAFALDLAGFDEDVIDKRVKSTAKILGLTQYLDRLPRALSGGQRQRVALGRAIIRNAKIFLMDEPLSNLDARQRVSMRSELSRIHREAGATTIYVTHDQIEAMTMASRIVCMDVGVIKQVGTPEELYFHPKNLFVAGFIGDPPMNFIKGKVKDGCFDSEDGFYHFSLSYFNDEQKVKLEGKNITLGYRPESAVVGEEIQNPDEYLEMKGNIEVYEMLGDLQNVYLSVGSEKAIIKAKPEIEIVIGADMTYYVKKSDFRFFDSDTEDAIELEESAEQK